MSICNAYAILFSYEKRCSGHFIKELARWLAWYEACNVPGVSINPKTTNAAHETFGTPGTEAGLEVTGLAPQTSFVARKISSILLPLWIGLMVCAGSTAQAQIPTTLTDKIYKGSGSIDLLKDVSAASLQDYLTGNGELILGVDLNENASGNENSDSVGIAIEQLELVITTTAGTFSFSDFWTSTTANIQEAGSSTANEFYTLFGHSGSSTITGGTTGFDLGSFDDVVELRNISFTGTLISAQVNVTFLNTANTSTQGNETFFDYSGGFEDFALIGRDEAYALEMAGAGLAAAPSGVSYTAESVAAPATAPGAPAPPFVLLAALAALVVWKTRGHG
jgi:hypothetical protein